MTIGRGIRLHDDRPRLRVRGGVAGEVAGIEFGEGSVDIVDVERDDRRDPPVGVDLAYLQDVELERLRSLDRYPRVH